MAAPEVNSTTPTSPPGSSGSKVHPTQAEERRSLLSPHADAVVSGAFNQLATTMSLSGSARTVEELVEDMLRPLLPSWLDVNLPPLVEKLVREEIQRSLAREEAVGPAHAIVVAGERHSGVKLGTRSHSAGVLS